MNFYEFYQIINENTVSQELKKIYTKHGFSTLDVNKIIDNIVDTLRAETRNFGNINDKSKTALAKWLLYTSLRKGYNNPDKNQPHQIPKYVGLGRLFLGTIRDFLVAKTDQNGNLDPQLISKLNNPLFTADEFSNLSIRYHEDLKNKQKSKPGRVGKTVLSFPDGYSWVDLERGYCEIEKETMGHCGNVGAVRGDTILSLRDKKNNPHLTFILNNGNLGEMKGRGNDKPAPKYRPYIIELLKLPIIKAVVGGGYLAANNFKLSDLNQEQIDELIAVKPKMEFSYYIEKLSNNEKVPEETLIRLIKSNNIEFNKKIAENAKSTTILNMLYDKYKNSANVDIIELIAYNENTDKLILADIFEKYYNPPKNEKDYGNWSFGDNFQIVSAIAANSNTPKEILKRIVVNDKGRTDLTHHVSKNPSVDPDLLIDLFNTGKRDQILSNPNMPEKILRMVVNSERYDDPEMPMPYGLNFSETQRRRLFYIIDNPKCPSDLIDQLTKIAFSYEEPYSAMIQRIAYHQNTKDETLIKIYKDKRLSPMNANEIHGILKEKKLI